MPNTILLLTVSCLGKYLASKAGQFFLSLFAWIIKQASRSNYDLALNLPELPEVETTRRGIEPHIANQTISKAIIRQAMLRWPVPEELIAALPGLVVSRVERRGKYLLLQTPDAVLIIHLGMSGSLRIVSKDTAAGKHDHFDFILSSGKVLRFTDPRRFGCLLWHRGDINDHKLIRALGPEPLTDEFDGEHLYKLSKGRKAPVKTFIMDSKVVVGVGNIYANEALYLAGIHPVRKAGAISLQRYENLASQIKQVLSRAIEVGGTTLRDFTNSEGEPGYFKQSLFVYGRGGQACAKCGEVLKEVRVGQRSTVYCGQCQR